MIRRPPRSTQSRSSAASDVYKRQVNGVTSTYGAVRNETVTEGEFITNEQYLGHASVAVIGPDLADKLFGRKEGLVGETLRLAGQPFRIIGVLGSKGGSAFG